MTSTEKLGFIPIIGIHGNKGSGKSYFAGQIAQFLLSSGKDKGDLINEKEVELLTPYIGSFRTGRVEIVSFAGLLKEILVAQNKATREQVLKSRKTREYRDNLIDTATNLRVTYGDSFFANALFTRIAMTVEKNGPTAFIIDDLREEHEEQAFLQFSRWRLLFTVNAPRRSADTFQREANGSQQTLVKHMTHSSETGLEHKTRNRETAEANGYHFVDNDYRF
jgi:hypothetical protein